MKCLTEKLAVAVLSIVMFAAVSHGADAKPKNLLKDWAAKKPLSTEIKVTDAASQTIVLNQKVATPITISAESKCKDVTDKPSAYYSVFANIAFMDGTSKGGVCAKFKTGTHDWEKAEVTYTPSKPIKLVRFYLLFRKRKGEGWFRNPSLIEGAAPKKDKDKK